MKITVNNLRKEFKGQVILRDVNLTMKSGHIYGLMGRNGSGKSVFLKLLCGFYLPTSGEILYDERCLDAKNEFPPNLRAFIEKPNFFPDLTGYDNLKLLADIQRKIGDEEINEALDLVCLTKEKDKKFSKYSLGTKQKLGIAQAIMEDPDILILDEPFNGVEETTVKNIMNYLKELKKQNKLIIISSHIKEDLLSLADEIYYFDNQLVKKYDESK